MWEKLPFETKDGRTHRCTSCWLTGPGWCPECKDTARRGWINDPTTNTARWCYTCGGDRTFSWGKKHQDDGIDGEKAESRERPAQNGVDTRKSLGILEDGTWPARWYRLRKTGKWGALAFDAGVQPGDTVTIQKHGEPPTCREVESILWSGDGRALCAIINPEF